jgi:hypothetical protein
MINDLFRLLCVIPSFFKTSVYHSLSILLGLLGVFTLLGSNGAHALEFPHLSQLNTSTPKAYCAPTSLTMGLMGLNTPHWSTTQGYSMVESLAKHYLHTDAEQGTTPQNMVRGSQDFLKQQFPNEQFSVAYHGIHQIAGQPIETVCPKSLSLSDTQVTVVHLGWYAMVPSKQGLKRLGGHYVLLNHLSRLNPGFYIARFNDPLLSEAKQEEAEYTHITQFKHLVTDVKRWHIQDDEESIARNTPLKRLWVLDPLSYKHVAVLPVLEGVLVIKRLPHTP